MQVKGIAARNPCPLGGSDGLVCLKETAWKRRVCNRTLTLKQAQTLELAYERKFG
jgi:hypothetical protein